MFNKKKKRKSFFINLTYAHINYTYEKKNISPIKKKNGRKIVEMVEDYIELWKRVTIQV
jgi:hypothetical protein